MVTGEKVGDKLKESSKAIQWPPSLVVLTDSQDAMKKVLVPKIADVIATHHKLIKMIHVTDQRPRPRDP